MEEYPVDDQQREAAVAHLAEEHARGAFDLAELERRTTGARSARTVAELLAATADPADTSPTTRPATAPANRVALLTGIGVAVVLVLVILSHLG